MDRRAFIWRLGLATAGTATALSCDRESPSAADTADEPPSPGDPPDWTWVRQQFNLAPEKIHLSALLVASHPAPVQRAIEQHRQQLNEDPVTYLERENDPRKRQVREEAANYLGVEADEIALTDSTTMGIGMVYNGLSLEPEQEFLTTEHDYYATHESLRLAAARTGASVREIRLYERPSTVSRDEIVSRITRAITPNTRILALTWVHSDTGLKLPLAAISEAVADINSSRSRSDRVLLGVDGVHGLGVEDVVIDDLGCDFFMSGCHKWMFGPRGTGLVWGRPSAWAELRPTIPSFMDEASWAAWATDSAPDGPTTAARMSPGGFKPFEHQWAMAEAFRFHRRIGKSRIARRTHELNRRLKEGLAEMPNVQLHTPLSDDLSAGIVCFSVDGVQPKQVVQRLRDADIVASLTPYARAVPRLTPSILNTEAEIDTVLQELQGLA